MKLEIPKIHEGEYRFCLILWKHEPVTAAQLAKLCLEQLGWKRTTTYTVLKRLIGKGYLKNEDATVTALVPREEVQEADGQAVLSRSFGGSLPSFLAAFLRSGSVSDQEAAELERMLADYRQGH